MADQENFPLLRFHPEIIVPQIFGVQTAFIPPVQDLNDPIALLLVNEGPGGFLSLIAGVALYFNLLKGPFFIHFFLWPQRTQRIWSKIKDRTLESNPAFYYRIYSTSVASVTSVAKI
jgi:hypothetical protein